MKKILLFSLLFLALMACKTKTNPNQTTTSFSEEVDIPGGQLVIEELPAKDFDLVAGDSLKKILIQRFCDESKGYQQNTWLGLNKCSWAIEKYLLEQLDGKASRQGNDLTLSLKSGKIIHFTHDTTATSSGIYYQFQKYLPADGYFVIEKLSDEDCPEALLIQAEQGTEARLEGIPHFAPDGKSFFLNGAKDHCLSTVEYWVFADGVPQKVWSIDRPDWHIREIKWGSDHEYLLALANEKEDLKSNKFLSLKLKKQ